ncbi:hypothetical protein QVD17_20431 [Tagetes erecta]|uniref:Uncharacterized protein n=1 Tax=Tagetes erecta TaxID=13708 RepID=A0AAD8NXW7_TARER|nr:hypothetical protein QVD17_20431 [Tagetes erecta]
MLLESLKSVLDFWELFPDSFYPFFMQAYMPYLLFGWGHFKDLMLFVILGPWKSAIKVSDDSRSLDIDVLNLMKCKLLDNGNKGFFWLDKESRMGILKVINAVSFRFGKHKSLPARTHGPFHSLPSRIIQTGMVISYSWSKTLEPS